jgi:hypothetical protein
MNTTHQRTVKIPSNYVCLEKTCNKCGQKFSHKISNMQAQDNTISFIMYTEHFYG